MIESLAVKKSSIRWHYDLSTVFYRMLWGPHIHHGLWDADEAPAQAQLQLIERLADLAAIPSQARVLDVGCGMGGSSIHLARTRECTVTGITLSPVQRWMAASSAFLQRTSARTRFICADAESVQFDEHQFDVVWSVECTEHLFDKAAFFRKASRWIRPGGRLAICAWLAGESLSDARLTRQVEDVCEGFLCPSLGTARDYTTWFEQAGLQVTTVEDCTERVVRTWEICQQRVESWRVRWLARMIDPETTLFLDRFQTILDAYRSGAMRYGVFIAERPA